MIFLLAINPGSTRYQFIFINYLLELMEISMSMFIQLKIIADIIFTEFTLVMKCEKVKFSQLIENVIIIMVINK